MSATARDCAFAWLDVARSAIERAAECAAGGEIEALDEYQCLRDELDEQVREAHYEYRISQSIRDRMDSERERAQVQETERRTTFPPNVIPIRKSMWEGA